VIHQPVLRLLVGLASRSGVTSAASAGAAARMLAASRIERMERVVMMVISPRDCVGRPRKSRACGQLSGSHSPVELDAGAATIATCYHGKERERSSAPVRPLAQTRTRTAWLIALLLELRRLDVFVERDTAEPGKDRDILLAAGLEGHRRRVEADATLIDQSCAMVVSSKAAKVPSVKPENTSPPAVATVPL